MDPLDEFAQALGIDITSPGTRLAHYLAAQDDELLESLVRMRKDRGMRQADVANALGRDKSSVSLFERLGADPRLSTIRRYAAAIGARITHLVEFDVEVLEADRHDLADRLTPDVAARLNEAIAKARHTQNAAPKSQSFPINSVTSQSPATPIRKNQFVELHPVEPSR